MINIMVIEATLSSSALATVQDRVGKIKGAAIEIKTIIEYFQMPATAGTTAAWELWEHALIPSLLSGEVTWLGEIREAINICESTKNFSGSYFLRSPNLAQRWP